MKKTAAYTAALLFVAASAFGATSALTPEEPIVIEIEVAPEELAKCQATLAQVMQMPVVADDGSPIVFAGTDDLPQVACVVRGA